VSLIASATLLLPMSIFADATTSTIQSQIEAQNNQITQLNSQIAQYQTQLNATTKKGQTLQGELNQISLTLKKTGTSITLSQTQINATQLQIQQLTTEITSKKSSIQGDNDALSESIRTLAKAERQPLAIVLLSDTNIADAWSDIDHSETLQTAFKTQANALKADQDALTLSQAAAAAKQAALLQTKATLQTQQGSLTATKVAQSQLLTATKAQESTYKTIIAQKKAQEASFEQDLLNLKASANQQVTAGQITPPSPGILQWPIAGGLTITQFFGNTGFASVHETLYSGHGHDGLDIGTPIGTPVHAALSGTVIGFGNTDATPGCRGGSFGMWIMLKHSNGLNTMYAHLSNSNVTQGETVSTGDVIGYSGETGYATGPHLHFGVYVSSVTQIVPLGQVTKGTAPCSRAIMPVPPVSGYLNPLNYLPSTAFKNFTGEPI
jgi:murein DD-endopeptidase MepM/ murein hydrolase activator NlpD